MIPCPPIPASRPRSFLAALCLAAAVALFRSVMAVADAPPKAPDPERPIKVFAHYMGCFPVGTGALQYHYRNQPNLWNGKALGHSDLGGDAMRNFPLLPAGKNLTLRESADLEIRRALRMGLDGFAMDAWAGGEDAQAFLDILFEVAEAKDYPFELTICLDPNTGGGGGKAAETVRWLLGRHGDSPKLARRDGKPLIFGYQSVWTWVIYLQKKAADEGFRGEDWAREVERLRTSPEGWKLAGPAYRALEKEIGEPIYWHFGMDAFFFNLKRHKPEKGMRAEALSYIARDLDAIGSFSESMKQDVCKAIRNKRAEYCHPLLVQYGNPQSGIFYGGPDWVRGVWAEAKKRQTRLIQITTWNDYNERTAHAPGMDSRYALLDLTAHHIAWLKTGQEPTYDRDKLYLFHSKYPKTHRLFPCGKKGRTSDMIYVVAILAEPGTLRLPGRETPGKPASQWHKAFGTLQPAGFGQYRIPATPGPVVVELVRNGKVVRRLESPEIITDKPFRSDSTVVGISTEFERHWKADFGDAPPILHADYRDSDGDGLPDWFEMFWFGRYPEIETATAADPAADPDKDGKSNLQEYLNGTDPTMIEAEAVGQQTEKMIQSSLLDEREASDPREDEILDDLE